MHAFVLLFSLFGTAPGDLAPDELARRTQGLQPSGEMDKACARFEQQYEADPTLRMYLDVAECVKKSGHQASAYWRFRVAETWARSRGIHARAHEARHRAEHIKARLSWLALSASTPLPGMLVSVDGLDHRFELGSETRWVAVDPGAVYVTASAPGARDWSVKLKLAVGEIGSLAIPSLSGVVDNVAEAPPPPAPRPVAASAVEMPRAVRAPVYAEVIQPAPAPSPVDFALSASGMGAVDSNVFDRPSGRIAAGGVDFDANGLLGVPLGSRVSWIGAGNFVANYRSGTNVSDGSNATKLDGIAKTGLEGLLFGKTSLPGQKVDHGVFPAMKLSLALKYAYTSNPVFGQQPSQVDETSDVLEPAPDEMSFEDDGTAGVPIGGQTYSNPNIHHRASATVRDSLEAGKRLLFTLDATALRDGVGVVDGEVSPNFYSGAASLNARYKLAPQYLWLTAGYSFEQRSYQLLTVPSGSPLRFGTHGLKVALDLPLTWVKLKLGYDLRLRRVGADITQNRNRHQVQAALEMPLGKSFSAVIDARFTDTTSPVGPDSARVITMAGLKGSI
jgi:hypothetical protein